LVNHGLLCPKPETTCSKLIGKLNKPVFLISAVNHNILHILFHKENFPTMADKKVKQLTQAEIEAKQKELANGIRKTDITEIAHKLKDCVDADKGFCDEPRFALFLGAGASFNSGIKTAGQMMNEFKEKILKRNCPDIIKKDEQEKWINKNVLNVGNGNEYSKLFEAFERTPTGRQTYISKIIKDKEPSFGYAMLASMIARNFINTILTTNFDDLVFIACNKFTGVRPVIYAYGIMATEMKFSMPHAKILKMHGDYLYSALANTEGEMKIYNQDPNMKSQVNHALNEYELIIFGYSGSDNSVMEVLEKYPPGKELYWCHWSKELPSIRALELLKEKDGTLVAIEGFDDAMYEIYKVIEFDLDGVLAKYEDRRTEVLRFIDKFDKKYSTKVITEAIEDKKLSNEDKKTPKTKIEKEPETWWESFNIAYDAVENGDDEIGEKYYRLAIKLNPNYASAYNNLGNLLSQNKRSWKEAETFILKSIELDTTVASVHINLGNLLSRYENREKEAEKSFLAAIALKPNFAHAYNAYGNFLYTKFDRWEEAEKCYKKAIELEPNLYFAYNSLGVLLSHKNKTNEAIENFKIAASINYGYVNPRLSLAAIYKKRGNSKNFSEYIKQVKAIIKENDYYQLARLNSILENKDEALKYLKIVVDEDPSLKNTAKTSINFDWIRDDPRFAEIVGE
jgi:tetratricopeptide (TPR) repeat protein